MNWLMLITSLFKLTPYIVAGVQALHPTESGTTKAQIATNLLTIATAGATQTGVLSSQNSAIAGAVSDVTQQIINTTVAVNKTAGVAGFSNSTSGSTGTPNAPAPATSSFMQSAPSAVTLPS